uniref:Uncharacterized protein n=1 Tax=Anguilla anguilla TaxID=7936 RepID=A0A0E9XAQ7_ANGAN
MSLIRLTWWYSSSDNRPTHSPSCVYWHGLSLLNSQRDEDTGTAHLHTPTLPT